MRLLLLLSLPETCERINSFLEADAVEDDDEATARRLHELSATALILQFTCHEVVLGRPRKYAGRFACFDAATDIAWRFRITYHHTNDTPEWTRMRLRRPNQYCLGFN